MIVTNEVSQTVFELQQELTTLARGVQGAFLQIGKILHMIDSCNGWIDLGYESFNSFLADPEIPLSVGTAYRCMMNYRYFIDFHFIEQEDCISAGISKLEVIRQWTEPRDEKRPMIKYWLAMAATNTRNDLVNMLQARYSEDELGTSEIDYQSGSKSRIYFTNLSELYKRYVEKIPQDSDHPLILRIKRILEESL